MYICLGGFGPDIFILKCFALMIVTPSSLSSDFEGKVYSIIILACVNGSVEKYYFLVIDEQLILCTMKIITCIAS